MNKKLEIGENFSFFLYRNYPFNVPSFCDCNSNLNFTINTIKNYGKDREKEG